MTLWSPDTCGCSIEYSDDDQFTQGKIHKVCAKHAAVPAASLLATLLAHNRDKNHVLNSLVETYGKALYDDAGAPVISVGYDPDADAADDPVIVTGLGNLKLGAADLPALQAQIDALPLNSKSKTRLSL